MQKPKLKATILSFYSGLVSRGVETFVAELGNRIKDRVELTIYHGESLPPEGNRLHYLFLDPPSLAIKRFSQKVLANLDPPDILMPLNNGWMSFLAKNFCRRHKTKLILAGFSGMGWDDKVNLWLKPDCFVAGTQYQAKWAKKINSRVRVETINIGVNTDKFLPDGAKFNHGLKPPVVLAVAGPEPTKRINLAIAAVSRLDASLLIAGRQTPMIDSLAKKTLGKRYQNILVNYDRLDSVYRSADVYTLPAFAGEAYGISILEALASGLPVVVNDDPVRRELAGPAGRYIDPTNTEAYASALAAALSHSDSLVSRRRAEQFSWEKISRQYLKLWLDLTSST